MSHSSFRPNQGTSHTSDNLPESLRLRLSWLSYQGFAYCAERLLMQLGYTNLTLSSRHSLRGRTASSGLDIRAQFQTPFGRLPVAIQLKRYKNLVPSLFVDQLRGTMLRTGDAEGLILATSNFSPKAWEAARQYKDLPVRLVDGAELGNLMLACRIGVRERVDLVTGEVSLEFDEEAFVRLEQAAALAKERSFSLSKSSKR